MSLPPSPRHPAAWTLLQWIRTPYPYLDGLRRTLGETFRLQLFGWDVVVFSNPEHVREIFADAGDEMLAGEFNRTLAPLLGDQSVLMVDRGAHRRKRKLLLPPFHGERMQAYGQTMLDVADDAIDGMPHGVPFSLHAPMQEITLRVIVRTIFGFEGAPAERMVRTLRRLIELGTSPALLLPFMQKDLGPLSPWGRFRRATRQGDAVLYEEIARRRTSGARGNDVLSLLLDAVDEDGKPMSDVELRDELVTLLVAGHETTATALTWAMRWLLDASGRGSLDALRAEIRALGDAATPARIASCELLDAVAREALRLVPVIPLVGRVLAAPRRIGGWDLPRGTIVTCSIYLAHRRPEAYPDPERFDPGRFLGKKASAHEFFPFGGGVRRCIGVAFALYEMKMVLARLVARTELALAPGKAVGMVRRSITITPSEGLRVVLKRRRPSQVTATTGELHVPERAGQRGEAGHTLATR
jgi:cytochrome P450